MKILKKDPNQVEVETETESYIKNLDFKLIWKDEVDMEEDNVLNDYNLVEALAAKTEEPKLTYEKQSIHEMLTDYTDIIYTNMKELIKTNISYIYSTQPQLHKNVIR